MPKKRRNRRRPVPPKIWRRVAEIIAAEHRMTWRALLYDGPHRIYAVPRAKFWNVLRSLRRKNGKPRFSLPAIAAITGHDHSTVLVGIASGKWAIPAPVPAPITPVPVAQEPRGPLSWDLTGLEFGVLTVLGLASPAAGASGRHWRCRCSCGECCVMPTQVLTQGKKTACGINGHRATPHPVTHIRPVAGPSICG